MHSIRAPRISWLVALAGAIVGCGAPTPPAPAADATYSVRAEVVRLPASPGGELYLRHEAIPEFRDRQGETVGMMSMTMPFTAGVDLAGVEPGARATFTFDVRWADRSPLRVTAMEPLPAGTRLEFDPEPESGEPTDAPSETSGEATAGPAGTQPEADTPR